MSNAFVRNRNIIKGRCSEGKRDKRSSTSSCSKEEQIRAVKSERIFKKRLPPPSSVMTMSHQLGMSGRPHGPHRWESQGPGQRTQMAQATLPRGRWVWWGYKSWLLPLPLRPLLSGRLTVMWSEVWGPDWQMSWLKTNCPLCFWPFWGCAASWLSNVCVGEWLWCDCCWYDTTNTGKNVSLSLLPSTPSASKMKDSFGQLKMWPLLSIEACTCPKIYQYFARDFITHTHTGPSYTDPYRPMKLCTESVSNQSGNDSGEWGASDVLVVIVKTNGSW